MRKIQLPLLFLVLVSLSLIAPFANAEIFLEQPASIYNLGDEITLSATVSELSDSYFDMQLICDNGKVIITHDILSSTIVKKTFTLTKAFINDLKGQCYITASYADTSSQSQAFEISDRIDAYLELDKKELNPSENVILRLDAVKATGKPVQGFAGITFSEAGISLTKNVIDGKFETNFSIPINMPSGTYSIKTEVYEKDKQGEITSKALLENNLFVKQEPRVLEISIESQEAKPGENYKFKLLVYDQTNQTMDIQARYSLFDGSDEKISDRIVNSNEEIILEIPLNESPGYRTITAKLNDFLTKRYFYIPEVEKVSFEIMNTTLKITNTGNVPYRKNIEVGIGEDKEVLEIKLAVGESATFNLQAPDGSYDIIATDGVETFSASSVPLTGSAVKVVDLSEGTSIVSRYSLVWLFILGVLGLFIFGLSKGLGKQKFMAHMPNLSALLRKKHKEVPSLESSVSTAGSSDIKSLRITPREAEHSLVIKGIKEPCSIVAVKIKNMQALMKIDYCKETLGSINSAINGSRGTLYNAGEFIIGILAPSATKTFKNEITGIKVAQKVVSILREHNSKFKDKISFGIGIHEGDLVVEIDKQTNKLKFTSLGNTISLARKIAESAENELLISQSMHKKTSPTVKTRKKVKGDMDIYEVTSIVDREENAEFISRFLERNRQ